MGIVYVITNKINGKKYVGITTYPLSKRWYEHRWFARNGRSNMTICRAIRKYGEENFKIEEIFQVFNDSDLMKLEVEFIKILSPEYNQTGGGELTKGRAHSEESRKARSDKMKKFYTDHPEQKYIRPFAARSIEYTDERKKLLSVIATGKKHSEESKQKMRDKAVKVPVVCVNDGKLFESARAADSYYNLCRGAVRQIISGKLKTIHGLRFIKQGVVAI